MSPPRPTDDGPLAAIFMLCLLLVVAGGGIWYSIREKPRVANNVNPGIETPWQMQSSTPSGGGLRFVEAFKRLPSDATSLQRAADQEFDNAARLLNADELAQINKILARKGSSRDSYNESDFDLLRRHGFGKWLRAQSIGWSQSDPVFKKVGESVWERSPQARDSGDLSELAARWGELDKMTRTKIYQAIQALETKARELTGDERDAVSSFAGPEFLTSRQ